MPFTIWQLVPASRADGIPREHLRSLVKDDDIEWKLGRFQVRADRERTHHPTRLASDESIRHTTEKLSQRQVSLLLVNFARKDSEFRCRRYSENCRMGSLWVAQQLRPDLSGPKLNGEPVESAEFLNDAFMIFQPHRQNFIGWP